MYTASLRTNSIFGQRFITQLPWVKVPKSTNEWWVATIFSKSYSHILCQLVIAKETEISYFNPCSSKSTVFVSDPTSTGCQESLQTERKSFLHQKSCCHCGLWIFTTTTRKCIRGCGLRLSSHGKSEESKRRGPKVTAEVPELVKLESNGHFLVPPTLGRSFSVVNAYQYGLHNHLDLTTKPGICDMYHDQLRVKIQMLVGDFPSSLHYGQAPCNPQTTSTGFHHENCRSDISSLNSSDVMPFNTNNS